jgi:uncharacterized membrane protein
MIETPMTPSQRQSPLVEFIKSTLIGGLLVILPIGLVVVMGIKIVGMLRNAIAPVSSHLPEQLHFPNAIAAILLLIVCFATGLVTRTYAGRNIGTFFERVILNQIPGYGMVRSLIRSITGIETSDTFRPAFVEIEDALVPAFVVEVHTDGRYTIFVPSAPTPGIGAIYIMDGARVHLLDTSLLKTVKCVSRWGAGSAELLQAMRKPHTDVAASSHPLNKDLQSGSKDAE